MRIASSVAVMGAVLLGPAAVVTASASSSRPPRPTEGTLIVPDGGRLAAVPRRQPAVGIGVAGFLAEVAVEQPFVNPYEKKIDAVYLFPLPTRAAVNEMEIDVGGRTIRGHIDRRAEARRKYE